MSATARGAAISLGLILLVMVGGAFAGFVYAYEPLPDEVVVRIDERALDRSERLVGGTIEAIEGNRLTLRTEGGTVDFTLPDGVSVEDLVAASAADLAPGTAVNVGGEYAGGVLVLTGIVALEAAP